MPLKLTTPCVALISFLVPAISHADIVITKSGDRLGGRILHKSGDILTLQTDYAGEIKVQWSKVAALVSDKPLTLQLDGDTPPLSAKVQPAEAEQQIQLAPADASPQQAVPQTVPLARVVYINPLPEETSNGVNYRGRANMSFSRSQGNTRTEALYGEVDFAARARQYRYELNAKANRSKDAGTLTNSNWLTGGNYDRFLDPRHFIYGRASVEHDEFKGISQRDVVGGGYGWQLIDNPQTQFSVRGGLDYVSVRHTHTGDENYPSLGWGLKFSHKLESYRAELFHEEDGFINTKDVTQITLRTRSGLRVPLLAGITATSQLNVDREGNPEPGRKAVDTLLLFGLGYEW